MTTALTAFQVGLEGMVRRLEAWQRDDAMCAAKLLDAAARSAEPAMREAFLTSLRRLRRAVRTADLEAVLLSGGSAEALLDLIPWDQIAGPPLREAWQTTLLDLVQAAQGIARAVLPEAILPRLEVRADRARDWAAQHAGQLVTGIGDGQRVAIREAVARSFLPEPTGTRPLQIAQEIKNIVGLTPKQAAAVSKFRTELIDQGMTQSVATRQAGQYADRARAFRAEMIARTETVGAAMQGQQATWADAAAQGLIQPGAVSRVWAVTDDDRLDLLVCAPMDGQRTTLAGMFTTGDGREISLPPAHPGCLTGDALITSRCGISAVSERWYDGEVVVLQTASGKHLTCTPNHPILTRQGWIAAHCLNVGGDVISRVGSEWVASTINPDHQDMPARIEEVAEAFRRSREMVARPVPTPAEAFHGDGRGSQVAVVRSHRLLWDRLDPAVVQHSAQMLFIDRHARTHSVHGHGLDGRGLQDLFFERGDASTSRSIGFRDLLATFSQGFTRPLQEFRFTLGSKPHVTITQGSLDRPSGDAMLAGELIDRLAGQIVCDKLIAVRRQPFSGHVYNLQTPEEWFVANGIVTHNCRCTVLLELPSTGT